MENTTRTGEQGVVIVRGGRQGFAQEITAGQHTLRADEPTAHGGTDTGPSPYELLLASLGACTSMTVRLYANRRGWPLEGIDVRLSHQRVHAQDCATCETKEGKLDRIERIITLEGPLDDAQRTKLLEIAEKCPVHRTLKSEILIQTRLA